MPLRITMMNSILSHLFEGTLFLLGLVYTGGSKIASALIDKETMEQLRSADGALFGASVIVVALWFSKIADGRRMDKRHDEMIRTMKDGNEKSEKLVAESIKAQLIVSHDVRNLTAALNARPCQLPHTSSKP